MTRWPVEPLTFSKKNPSRANGRSTYIHPPSLVKIRQRTSEETGNTPTNTHTHTHTNKRCSNYSMIYAGVYMYVCVCICMYIYVWVCMYRYICIFLRSDFFFSLSLSLSLSLFLFCVPYSCLPTVSLEVDVQTLKPPSAKPRTGKYVRVGYQKITKI